MKLQNFTKEHTKNQNSLPSHNENSVYLIIKVSFK